MALMKLMVVALAGGLAGIRERGASGGLARGKGVGCRGRGEDNVSCMVGKC